MSWTSPRTWVAAETVTAAICNTHIRDNFKAIGDPRTTYAPTLTNVTLGTGGTTVAAYSQGGKDTRFRIVITLGTSGALTGTMSVTLPATPFVTTNGYPLGVATLIDTSASASVSAFIRWSSSSSAAIVTYNATATTTTAVAAATPWTWAATDVLMLEGAYEAA